MSSYLCACLLLKVQVFRGISLILDIFFRKSEDCFAITFTCIVMMHLSVSILSLEVE